MAISYHLLLIHDDRAMATRVRDLLRGLSAPIATVAWVRTLREGLDWLSRPRPAQDDGGGDPRTDAILVDLRLTDGAGPGSFAQLIERACGIPVLVLSGAADEPAASLALRAGAQDYLLVERLDDYSLPKAIRGAIERAALTQQLVEAKERAQVTLDSIGDAVLCTNVTGHVTYLNAVAQRLTGWSQTQACGRPLREVLHLIDGADRHPASDPMAAAIRENRTVSVTANCVLVRRDGAEAFIEDSAAPIHDRHGRIIGAVMVFRDVSVARAQAAHMAHLAQHDSLTGLANRVLLNDRLGQATAHARRYRHLVAVLYLDIDGFKRVNDSLGHDIGDRLLQSVAKRLIHCVRSCDTVSRLGGDEFVIVLPEIVHSADAAACAMKILSALQAPHLIGGQALRITPSIGIATYPEDGVEADTLLRNADLAMYEVKDHGRNGYKFSHAELMFATRRPSGLRLVR